MKKLLAVLAAAAMLTACDSIPADNANSTATTEQHEGHDHEHGHEHADEAEHHHDHEHAEGHEHGEHHELGSATAAGVSFDAHQMGHGANGDLPIEIELAKDSPAPKAIRAWIGNQSAEGSMKTRADGNGPTYELHLELPDPLPTDAQIWIEIEPETGDREAKPFNIVPDTE